MELTKEVAEGLGVAFNEATVLGVELIPSERRAGVTLELLTLPEVGPPPEDTRVQLRMEPVGRLAASLRLGLWNDPTAQVVPFEIGDLLETVRSLGCLPVYGWEFFDQHERDFTTWSDRLSLDWKSGRDGMAHSFLLFQEGNNRHLDICVWFDSFEIVNPSGDLLKVEDVIAGGERWWKAFHASDPRTEGRGLVPMRHDV